MMRRLSLLTTAALMVAASTFIGCSASVELDDQAQTIVIVDSTNIDGINWKDENGGTLQLMNNTSKDIVLFKGNTPSKDGLLGGIRAGSSKDFDVSRHVPDFGVGGYMVLRGMSKEEYEENKNSLSKAKMEFSAMATYKADTKFRIAIESDYTGNYGFVVSNTGRVGLELRKNGPEGEKIAYLPPLQVNQYVYTQTTDALTIFPVYVYYNKQTQTINTLNSTSMFDAVTMAPRPIAGSSSVPTVNFPTNPNETWASIVSTLTSPVAYVTIRNNVMNQAAYVTLGGSLRTFSQNGYDAIGSGEQLLYEVEAAPGPAGQEVNITLNYYNGLIKVPVVVDWGDGNLVTPVMKNGFDYTISVTNNGSLQNIGDYKARITESEKERDISNEVLGGIL